MFRTKLVYIYFFKFKESTKGYKQVITVTNYFSKWVEAVAVKDKSADTIAEFLIKLILQNGAPGQ